MIHFLKENNLYINWFPKPSSSGNLNIEKDTTKLSLISEINLYSQFVPSIGKETVSLALPSVDATTAIPLIVSNV